MERGTRGRPVGQASNRAGTAHQIAGLRLWGTVGVLAAGIAAPVRAQEVGGPIAPEPAARIAVADTVRAASPVIRANEGLSTQATLGEVQVREAELTSGARRRSDSDEARPHTLERAVAIALRNNRQLAISQYDLKTANKQVSEAYGAMFPEVDGTASMQRNLTLPEVFLPAFIFDPTRPPDELVPVTFGADNQWAAGLTVNQPLFDPAVFVGVGTAAAFRHVAQGGVRATAQQVATSTRIAYLNVLLAQEAVRVTQNSIERVRQTLEETRALNRAGLASDYDVLRLEVQLANIEPNLKRAQNEVSETQRVLAIEMGVGEAMAVAALGELHQINLAPGAENGAENAALLGFAGVEDASAARLAELEAIALQSRADLQVVRFRKDLEEARVRYERTLLFPRLSAFFNWSLQAQENGALNFYGENSNQRTTSSAVGVQLEVPIFSGARRWNRIEQRKIGVRQAEEQLADLAQRAINEVETVLEQLDEARSRAGAQRQAVSEAQRGFDIVRTEYLAGTQARLEVTEAELALRQAEQNYALAVYDFLVAQARLDLAVGVVPVVDPVVDQMIEGDIGPEDRVTPDPTADGSTEGDREGDR